MLPMFWDFLKEVLVLVDLIEASIGGNLITIPEQIVRILMDSKLRVSKIDTET